MIHDIFLKIYCIPCDEGVRCIREYARWLSQRRAELSNYNESQFIKHGFVTGNFNGTKEELSGIQNNASCTVVIMK